MRDNKPWLRKVAKDWYMNGQPKPKFKLDEIGPLGLAKPS